MNKLYQELLNQQSNQSQNPQQQNNNFFVRLNNFTKNFSGDPKQQVQQLMQSGKVSQEQYNNAVQQANMIYSMLRGGK